MESVSTDGGLPGPVVTIVGRPNVGKSTLYNRLLGRRIAITHARPGITRDVLQRECRIAGVWVQLQDTGGLWHESADRNAHAIDKLVAAGSLEALERADLVLLVLDVTELTSLDRELIERLRRHSDRLITAVNKVDSTSRRNLLADFYALGLPLMTPISAEHNLNVDLLKNRLVERLAILAANGTSAEKGADNAQSGGHAGRSSIKLAIVGQPNSGKSTLLNALTGRPIALVSAIPGTTRDVVQAKFVRNAQHYRVCDTAGIRRRKRISDAPEYYAVERALSAVEQAGIVLLLIDIAKGLTDQDKKIASAAIERGRGLIFVLNKWDLLAHRPNLLQAIEDRIRFLFPVLAFVPIVTISALQADGFDMLFAVIERIEQQLQQRIDTGPLNREMARWVSTHPPPIRHGRRLRVRYITQVSSNPLRFVLFVNRVEALEGMYRRYLSNRIRQELRFPDVPFLLEVRDGRTPP